MPTLQKDRIYSLKIGTADQAIEINNLQIQFEVTKTSSNKDNKNNAKVQVYNLSEDTRRRLDEDYVTVQLSVGYAESGLLPLFAGEVVNVGTKKLDVFNTKRSGTDLITTLDISELWHSLNGTAVSAQIPSGNTVRQTIQRIIRDIPEITRQEMRGNGISKALPNGYSLAGSPKQLLDKLSRDFDLEYQIDTGVLYVSDASDSWSDSEEGVFLIGQDSGLIDRPEYINEEAKRVRRKNAGKAPRTKQKKNAVKCRILLNAALIAGSIIKLEFEPYTGYYKIDEVKHVGDYRNQTWYSELTLTEKVS